MIYSSKLLFSVSGSSILIAGGSAGKGQQAAYILNIYFDDINPAKIVNVSHSSLPRIPFKHRCGFYESCEGRLIIGGGQWRNQVYELDGIDFMDDLPSTKMHRELAAAVYHSGRKILIVSGGRDKNGSTLIRSDEVNRRTCR